MQRAVQGKRKIEVDDKHIEVVYKDASGQPTEINIIGDSMLSRDLTYDSLEELQDCLSQIYVAPDNGILQADSWSVDAFVEALEHSFDGCVATLRHLMHIYPDCVITICEKVDASALTFDRSHNDNQLDKPGVELVRISSLYPDVTAD